MADRSPAILHINTQVRPRVLQIALLVPLLAALPGLWNGCRMTRLTDAKASAAAEALLGGRAQPHTAAQGVWTLLRARPCQVETAAHFAFGCPIGSQVYRSRSILHRRPEPVTAMHCLP